MNPKVSRSSSLMALALGIVCFGLAVYAWVARQKITVLESALAATARDRLPAAPGRPANASNEDPSLLRQLLQERESAYQQLQADYERLKNEPAPAAGSPTETARTSPADAGSGRGDFLERLRTENPERFQQLQQARDQRRQELETQYQQQLARLQERRQKAATAEEAAHLDELTGALTKLHDVGQSWESLRQLNSEERAQQLQQLALDSAAAYQSYRELKTKDRQWQLSQLASQLGYQDPAQFSAAVQRIYDETDPSLRNLVGRGGFGRNRGGPASP